MKMDPDGADLSTAHFLLRAAAPPSPPGSSPTPQYQAAPQNSQPQYQEPPDQQLDVVRKAYSYQQQPAYQPVLPPVYSGYTQQLDAPTGSYAEQHHCAGLRIEATNPTRSGVINGEVQVEVQGKRALIFTMSSTPDFNFRAKWGGPAGEIMIQNSLESELQALGFTVHVATSDENYMCVEKAAMERGGRGMSGASF
jgi:hypothetical protein